MPSPSSRPVASRQPLLLGLLLGSSLAAIAACGEPGVVEGDLVTGEDAPVVDARPPGDVTGDTRPPPRVCPERPETGYALELFAEGLNQPLLLLSPPGEPDVLVVAQQGGLVRLLIDGELQEEPYLDVSALTAAGGERGLLGLAFHPDYAKNGRLFINYTDLDGNSHVDGLVAEGGAGAGARRVDPDSRYNVLFQEQPFPNHNGGSLAFGPDGYLYIGFGDGGSQGDPSGNGQRLDTWLAKVLRIDVDRGGDAPYAVPSDNPFVDMEGARREIWLYGVRNPWRFSFDSATGDFYIGDVGGSRWEEINVTGPGEGGLNFGWVDVEGPECSGGDGACDLAAYTPPVVAYSHDEGCSVTGGHVYRGCEIPELQGRYFYADYCTGIIRSFVYANGEATDEQDHTDELNGPQSGLSSFGIDGNGELYLMVLGTGEIYRFVAR